MLIVQTAMYPYILYRDVIFKLDSDSAISCRSLSGARNPVKNGLVVKGILLMIRSRLMNSFLSLAISLKVILSWKEVIAFSKAIRQRIWSRLLKDKVSI